VSSQQDERQSERTPGRSAGPAATGLAVAAVGLLILLLTGAGVDAHAVAMAVGQSLLTAGAIGVVLQLGKGRD
jgi:hypothetical protein